VKRIAVAVAALAGLAPASAGAAGFGIYDQGARAMGGAGAFTARADDPSSIFFNPAGISHLEGKSLVLSPNLIYYKSEFSGEAPFPGYGVEEETKGAVFPPFSVYYAQRAGESFALGLGVFNPYGLSVEWENPDTFTGRAISTDAGIQPFYIVPTAAWQLSEHWRLGVGVNLVFSDVELRRHMQVFNPAADQTVDIGKVSLESERNFGYGFNGGVQWWPSDRMRWGLTWRGAVDIDYVGNADFTQLPTGDPAFDQAVAAGFPPDQGVTTSIMFPAQASFGVARQFNPEWSAELDVNWTNWSAFDEIVLVFSTTPAINQTMTQDWDDAWNVRVGFEHRGAGGTSPWAWRGGYLYDESPQPTEGVGPLLPDANRHGLTGGAGWRNESGSTAVDGFVQWLLADERSTGGINRDGYNGTYASTSIAAGVSLGLSFR
jgi:long-chain fatty acid transport protein